MKNIFLLLFLLVQIYNLHSQVPNYVPTNGIVGWWPFTGNAILLDNWDLSVKRSTAIVRVLTKDLGVKPSQLIAAGRSEFIPLVDNNSSDNRAKNRRTRVVILPKIDEFYEMIEKEMKNQKK